VIRAGLRLLEDEESQLESLRKALVKGEESEMITNFNPTQHLEKVQIKKHDKNIKPSNYTASRNR